MRTQCTVCLPTDPIERILLLQKCSQKETHERSNADLCGIFHLAQDLMGGETLRSPNIGNGRDKFQRSALSPDTLTRVDVTISAIKTPPFVIASQHSRDNKSYTNLASHCESQLAGQFFRRQSRVLRRRYRHLRQK